MGWPKGRPSPRKGKKMEDVLGDRYLHWKELNDLTRPRGLPTLNAKQEERRRQGISKALTGSKRSVSCTSKGKTLEQIYGVEKATEIRKVNKEKHTGLPSGMKGKPAWNKGIKLSEELKELYSRARIKAILRGTFNPQKHRFKAISKWVHSIKGGGEVYCQGSWECKFVDFLESDSDVVKFRKDKIRILYRYLGKDRVYIVDFQITFIDGTRALVEIKPNDMTTKDENPAKFEAARKWCEENQHEFIVITEKEFNFEGVSII